MNFENYEATLRQMPLNATRFILYLAMDFPDSAEVEVVAKDIFKYYSGKNTRGNIFDEMYAAIKRLNDCKDCKFFDSFDVSRNGRKYRLKLTEESHLYISHLATILTRRDIKAMLKFKCKYSPFIYLLAIRGGSEGHIEDVAEFSKLSQPRDFKKVMRRVENDICSAGRTFDFSFSKAGKNNCSVRFSIGDWQFEEELEELEDEVVDTEKVLAQFRRWLDSGKLKYRAPSDRAVQYAINLLESQRGVEEATKYE